MRDPMISISVQFPVTTGKMTEVIYMIIWYFHILKILKGFPGGAVVKNLPANAGGTGSSPGLGRSHMPQSN